MRRQVGAAAAALAGSARAGWPRRPAARADRTGRPPSAPAAGRRRRPARGRRGDVGDRPLGGVREAVGPRRGGPERDPGQPVRRRLDDHQVSRSRRTRAARLRQPGGERGHLAGPGRSAGPRRCRCRRPPRAVGQHRHAERVLEQRLVGRPVAEAEVEQAGADGGVDAGRRRRQPQRRRSRCRRARAGRRRAPGRRSGRTRPRPAARRAGPRWWCRRPRRPRRCAGRRSRAGGCRPSRPTPGRRHQATSHGLDSRRGAVALHPLPAVAGERAHLAGGQRDPAQRWFTVSATTTSYPTSAATSAGSRHRPLGSLNRARSRARPRPASATTVSARRARPARGGRRPRRGTPPPASADRLGREPQVGGLDRPAATYGESPRLQRALGAVLLDAARASSASMAWAWPSPAYCATT